MKAIRGLFLRSRIEPVTVHDVDTPDLDPRMREKLTSATGKLVAEVMKVERRSREIREELATGTLSLVAGNGRKNA